MPAFFSNFATKKIQIMKTFIYKFLAPTYRLCRFFYSKEHALEHLNVRILTANFIINAASIYILFEAKYHFMKHVNEWLFIIVGFLIASGFHAFLKHYLKVDEIDAVYELMSKTEVFLYSIAFIVYVIATFALFYLSGIQLIP